MTPEVYPSRPADRDAWVLQRRGPKNRIDPFTAYGAFTEQERSDAGLVSVATILLSNIECPWRCLMCDLWRNTLDEPGPPGAIPRQIEEALRGVGPASWIKLYNAGSFFDPRAIPPEDYQPIAGLLSSFERVIVESHPALLGARCLRFQQLLGPQLEVAMGLETADPNILERLNKKMTIEAFAEGAAFLQSHRIGLRVFLLVQPPFISADAAAGSVVSSAEFAFDHGAGQVVLIPTRTGNGALDALALSGDFAPPELKTIEDAFAGAIELRRGRVTVDLWDLERFADCPACFAARRSRLQRMNLEGSILPRVSCGACRE